MRPARAVSASLAVVVAATLTAAPTASAVRPATELAPPARDTVLDRAAHGKAAVERLGDDLAEVAELNDMTAPELRRRLLDDPTLWVHPTGLLYFVDPVPEDLDDLTSEPGRTLEVAEAPYPYSQTFQLHSKPGSSRTIYLDFNGEHVSGTAWNEIAPYLLGAQTHPAFSLDGDPTTFSDAEQDAIQSIWQRVSEDYAPFDVDVTTADPGLAALRRTDATDTVYGTRALITPSAAAADKLCAGTCGGIAFMGTYDVAGTELGEAGSDYAQPAWVFPQQLGNSTKAIAEAVSHEVGHNVGLDHDGTAAAGYFGGHNAWAPIMGNSYGRPISQWSAGEYDGATRPPGTLQTNPDDLTVINQNGLSYQPDDHGNTIGTASPMSAVTRTASGLITTREDRDVFAFTPSCSGNVTFTVTPAPTSPNLDVRLRLLSGTGSELAADNPVSGAFDSDVATGMGAGAAVPVSSGSPVYVEVDGVGAGSPASNGYSDYASIGRYTVDATECSDAPSSRPDLLISTKAKKGYIGDDVYNRKGKQQTKQLSGRKGQLRSFFVRLTNDGSTTDTFAVTAAEAPKGAKITYWNGGTDITQLLTSAGGGVVQLTTDQFALIRVDVKLTKKAVVGSRKTAVLTALSQGAERVVDVVKATVKVVRK
jgi:hypothetical protein